MFLAHRIFKNSHGFYMLKYVFREYDPHYKLFFLQEKKKILSILGDEVKIEHVGSTAIEGLGGKGILDILIGVKDGELKTSRKKLEDAGYEFRESASTAQRDFFRIDYIYKKEKRRVHIHLTKYHSKDWKEIIGFRDYLLKHPSDAVKYAKIKKEAVKEAQGDGVKYRKYKEKFITDIFESSD